MDTNREFIRIRKEIRNNDVVQACARRHGTIGDITAMRICYIFRHYPELSVSDIAALAGISVSAASRQLKKLKNADIVKASKQAQTVYYSLQDNEFTANLVGELEAKDK